uniref:ATP-grasp domain-containing protein n=2 Tax=Ditylum brightwellii TaxID=49249 RepID=A0A7S4RCM3_9STRA
MNTEIENVSAMSLIRPDDDQVVTNNMENIEHEALVGAELQPKEARKAATIATLGDTPFSSGGEELEHHAIVATEIVSDPVEPHHPDAIQVNAVVLLDPRLTDCPEVLEATKRRGLITLAVIPKPKRITGSEFYPTAEALLEIGVHQVYEPPIGQNFDITECANHLQTVEQQQNLRFLGVIPLREAAVDYSDILAAMLGLHVHNDLGLCSARRDKGLMKTAVANAGLRVAKFARLTAQDGSDVPNAIKSLELDFPVVVKTPRGMSTMDVYICGSMEEAVRRSGEIVRSVGPDGKKANYSLLEEFLVGNEFAVNLIASPTTPRGVQVTDIWEYNKISTDGTMVNTWQTMVDPHSDTYAALVRYAEGVCRAVGIKYGFAHVELMSRYDEKKNKFVEPVMVEVGARLAGGRKAIMAGATVPGWKPFDAMVDAHCGVPVRVPARFSPAKIAKQVYVPSTKSGKLIGVEGDDFDRLKTYDSSIMLVKVGDQVKRARDLMSFCAYVWLIGSKEDVEADAKKARDEFIVDVEEQEPDSP